MKIKLLKSMPEIIGLDLFHYGPFKAGDTADVPQVEGILLINNRIAEEAKEF